MEWSLGSGTACSSFLVFTFPVCAPITGLCSIQSLSGVILLQHR